MDTTSASVSPGAGGPLGGGLLTDTVTLADAEPFFFFEHVSVKVLVATRPETPADPAGGFPPDHPPDATQDVALVDVQLRVTAPPGATLMELADRATVGVLLFLVFCRLASFAPREECVAEAAIAGAAAGAVALRRIQVAIQASRRAGPRPWLVMVISP
jgi:hypothetical protein